MYVRVAVDTGSTSQIDSLTYEIPDGLSGTIGVGSCVLVPLGPRQAVGYVIGFEETPEVPSIRPIISELESPVRLSEDMLRLAEWVSEQYLCSLSHAVMSMVPGIMHCRVQARVAPLDPPPDPSAMTPSEKRLWDALLDCGGSPPPLECGDSSPLSGVSVESLHRLGDRTAIQRLLRQLESKGFVRRIWLLVAPEGKPRVMRGIRLLPDAPADAKLKGKQQQALELITGLGRDVSIVELAQRYGVSRSTVEALEKKGLVEWVDMVFRRAPAFVRMAGLEVTLSDDQQAAVDAILRAIDARGYAGFLLHGVTASGKTEVYLRCIERALAAGRTSLVLLPEIALTTQVTNIFKSRFGDEVAVMHSGLAAGERCDEWTRAQRGEARVVLGARSAVFAPLENLGLVVVDEEHDSSYKQDNPPRYNGRDVAIRRAMDSGAALVLGSATPSVETYHLAAGAGGGRGSRRAAFRLLAMPSRVENRPMPEVRVVDLREEVAKGRSTIFSEPLEESIREHLSKRRQVMLLQNRRAYSTFLLCRECGFVPYCPNCAVSLKFHAADRKLSCHHCEHEEAAPTVCPKCGGLKIRRFGIGTERVEEETKALFPDARVLRMDRDTTSRKGAHASILNQFRRADVDILVGTQMIAKGLDFPNVTLVGVISADTSLHLPDFRSSERTFQLISQIAGRSGRGVDPGEVVVQTFDPDNYAIQCAVNHDYLAFYDQELEMRRELNYPPFASLVNVISRDPSDRAAEKRLREFVDEFDKARGGSDVELAGPVRAVLAKLRGEYRWHAVLRSPDRQAMIELLSGILDRSPELRRHLAVDVDPASML